MRHNLRSTADGNWRSELQALNIDVPSNTDLWKDGASANFSTYVSEWILLSNGVFMAVVIYINCKLGVYSLGRGIPTLYLALIC